jgi:protein involved in polysaccharide export with SLBB domain
MWKILLLLIAFGLPAASQTEARYIIHPGDTLLLRVWRRPDLSGPLVVHPSGNIRIPELGNLPAAGMSTTELAGLCEQQLISAGLPHAEVLVQIMGRAKERKPQAAPERRIPISGTV